IVTIILAGSLSGSAIHEAFLVLLDMTIILSLAPSLFIFASLPVLRLRARGNNAGVFLIPGGTVAVTLLATLGFVTTLFAIIVAMIPPDAATATWFFAKVFGGTVILVGVGLGFYFNGRARVSAAGSR